MMRGVACFLLLSAALVVQLVSGHGNMVHPPSWFDAGGKLGMGSGQQCAAGCTGKRAPGQLENAQGCACEWYSNYTFLPDGVEPTIARDSPLRTYMDWNFHGSSIFPGGNPPNELIDWTARHPWRAPGRAPVWSPCGVDGGNPKGCPSGSTSPDGCAGGGYAFGPDARNFHFRDVVTTQWNRGAAEEVAWSITANHGGGYSYRLCSRPNNSLPFDLTEDCFQRTPLDFVGDTWWAQFGTDRSTRLAFNATRTRQGTWPAGSEWAKNPIPACVSPGSATAAGRGEGHSWLGAKPCTAAAFNGSEWDYAKPSGTQFPPPGGFPSKLPDHRHLCFFFVQKIPEHADGRRQGPVPI